MEEESKTGRGILTDLGLAAALAAGIYFLFGDLNLNLADEGFLWYGVLQTRAGEVPLRDFQSYDPGRYYWGAAWSLLFGKSILGLRASLAVAQGFGLFFGLRVLRRVTDSPALLAIAAVVLAAWMFPMHKIFESAIAMAVVLAGVRLVEVPSHTRTFEAGATTGLAAWLGRNHGLYSGLAFSSLLGFMLWKGLVTSPQQTLRRFLLGGIIGAAPLWLMLIFVPGFAGALQESIAFNLTTAVNLPLPYLWPWRFSYATNDTLLLLGTVCTAVSFVLPVVLYPLGLIMALRTPAEQVAERAPIVAATFAGIFFLHHASVRSDIPHLAQAIHPLLLLLLVLAAGISRRAAVQLSASIAICGWTLLVAVYANPQFVQIRPGPRADLVAHDVAGATLRLPSSQAAELDSIEAAVRSHVRPDDQFFVAPTRPVFYPLFGKKCPDWWLYLLLPATPTTQRRTIERLESAGVRWALIIDETIDDRDDLRFENSHAEVWTYLTRSFARVEDPRLPPNYWLMKRLAF